MSRAAEQLRRESEVAKLARVLQREPDSLAYLQDLPVEDLCGLREQITATLYDSDNGALGRLAAASRILPTALTATIGQRAFGPLLSARLAGLLDPDRAVDVAGKMEPGFLAEVAVELDPRRASTLISRLSPELISQVTGELLARGEYVTMGRFVGHLGDDAITAAVTQMSDRDVLSVAFVIEQPSQLTGLLGKLPRGRMRGIVAAAAAEGWWLQALDLLNHLSARQRRDMITATLALGAAARADVVTAVIEHELWDEALLIAVHDPQLPGELAQRLSALPARRRTQVSRRGSDSAAFAELGLAGQALTGS